MSKEKSTILSWLFRRDKTQSRTVWFWRAAAVPVILFGIVFAIMPINIPVVALLGALAKTWAFYLILALLYCAGLFAFLPRKYLDRQSWAATSWAMLAGVIAVGGIAYLIGGQNLGLLIYPVMLLIFIFSAGYLAAITCFARQAGFSRLQAFLHMPFGISFTAYIGYFLPSKKAQVLEIKQNWYQKFITFLLNDNIGQVILAAVLTALLFLMFTWPEFILAVLVLAIYIVNRLKSGWANKNMKFLAWIAVAANLWAIWTMIVVMKTIAAAVIAKTMMGAM